MDDDTLVYNSRITNVYIEYIAKHYPNVDIDLLLKYADMTRYEVKDSAHWFSQNQVDRFHEIMVKKTGNPNIPREAGRHAVSSDALGAGKQYALGLMSLTSVYILIEKLYAIMSRAANVKAKKLATNKVEIISTPKPGVNEKPYQCENRMGTFESLSKLFTDELAKVEHPSCFHKGDDSCRYIITWGRTRSLTWNRVCNYSLLASMLVSLTLFFVLPTLPWVFLVLFCVLLAMTFSLYSQRIKRKELSKTIETQGDAAKDLLDEMNIRYNNALLIQEIGQATSTILDINKVTNAVVKAMEKRLDFDRGMIMLANEEKTLLVHTAGYGYSKEEEKLLQGTEFHLDKPESKGLFVLTFKEQKPFLVNDISEVEKQFSKRSQELAKQLGARSLICVPIVYEKETLGILAVDNIKSKRLLTQSDMSLLAGAASQTAASIVNAMSFQRLQESEKKYRELVENANSIILRMDTEGNITFFNEFAQRFFDYSEDEILGKNAEGTIFPKTESTSRSLEKLAKSFQHDPEQQLVSENECILRNGKLVWIAWTYKPIFDIDGRVVEMLCIGNDITALRRAGQEKKELEAQLQVAQKMEAIGTLAGGIAHDFNNILQTIFGYTQILMMKNKPGEPDYKKLEAIKNSAQRASDLTKRLLIFGRKVKSKLMPVDLNQEVMQVSEMLEQTIPKMINIELHLGENLKVINADPVQIEQILMNLGINSRDAMPDGGSLTFETRNVTFNDEYCRNNLGSSLGEYVLLSVSDNGHGINKETQEHIFEPFFTTKRQGDGTGLGLAVVYGIVKSHKGYISCQSEPGNGVTFKIYFPVIERETETFAPNKVEVPPRGGSESILLVDDEESIRKQTQEMLGQFGYSVLTASDGESALELYRKACEYIDLIVLDLIMPGMGGSQCLKKLLKINPRAKVLVVSGYSVGAPEREALETVARGFVDKPYEMGRLLEAVREVLDGD